jgi:hypothetical protein
MFGASASMVTEIRNPEFTFEIAVQLMQVSDELGLPFFEKTKRKVRVVHNWRAVQSYEAAARDAMASWAFRKIPITESVYFALSPEVPSLLRVTVTTTLQVLRVFGVKMEVGAALKSLGIPQQL